MNKPRALRFILATTLLAGFSTATFGQTRTWVSGVGNDANPCSRTAPCKTFAGALSKTADGGEISVLDPGGFGSVTIGKGLTINGTGTLAGILNSVGTNGVVVNAPATSTIILRDISINGAGTGANGIRYLGGKTLMVDHCWIYGQNNAATSRGIDVALGGNGTLKVINSVIENINEDGIHLNTTSGIAVAIIDNTSIMNCGQDGIEAAANVRADVTRSLIAVIGAHGISASGSNSQFNLDDTTVAHCNTTGLRSSAGDSIRVSDSIIANNSAGINANGGTIDSFQGNSLIGNPVPGSFTTTTNKQ
ncbi:MAG: right-handed parallel beta-helix repeat-containing protein [Chthoniobacterales bacterium]|jgi:hypothetical protein